MLKLIRNIQLQYHDMHTMQMKTFLMVLVPQQARGKVAIAEAVLAGVVYVMIAAVSRLLAPELVGRSSTPKPNETLVKEIKLGEASSGETRPIRTSVVVPRRAATSRA